MQDQILCFENDMCENDQLVKSNEVFYFIESHYNDFVHISFDSTKLYIFKLVPNPLQKLKNGPLPGVSLVATKTVVTPMYIGCIASGKGYRKF